MPAGTYRHLDGDLPDDDRAERFHCAPGPGGWRYTSTRPGLRTDIVVDSRWRQIRVEVVAPHWWVRGGVTGPDVAWVRASGDTGTEHTEHAIGFMSDSPGFLVAVARTLDLADGTETDVRLVSLTGPSLAPLTAPWRWRRAGTSVHDTGTEPLPVTRYDVTDLSTGEITQVHLAGDVVLDAPGIELADLESPPNLPS